MNTAEPRSQSVSVASRSRAVGPFAVVDPKEFSYGGSPSVLGQQQKRSVSSLRLVSHSQTLSRLRETSLGLGDLVGLSPIINVNRSPDVADVQQSSSLLPSVATVSQQGKNQIPKVPPFQRSEVKILSFVSLQQRSVNPLHKKRQKRPDEAGPTGPVAKRMRYSTSTPKVTVKPVHDLSLIHEEARCSDNAGSSSSITQRKTERNIEHSSSLRAGIAKPKQTTLFQSGPQQPDDEVVHSANYEARPWQRLVKQSADQNQSPWLFDVKSRPVPSSKTQDLSDNISWGTVHPSSRNKKQHLRQFIICESESGIDDDSLESVSMSQGDSKKQLQEQVKALTLQNAQKDAKIKALQQHLKTTKNEVLKGRMSNQLKWHLVYKHDGTPLQLGNGSYGRVYKGHCDDTGKFLAAKVVQELTKKAADALKKEVQKLSAMKPHHRIVTYVGTCYAMHPTFNVQSLYVFTEFMPGGSLSSYLKKKGPLCSESVAIMWRFTRQILEGVEYLHKCRIIHRDIKGSNIMCDLQHNLKLADFGSAKEICSESLDKDKTKYLYGTAPWAAPELLRGEKAQHESDIWSVAATVVEMATGKPPYVGENFISHNIMAIIFQVGSYKINPLTSMKKSGWDVADNLERFLSSCFESAASDRPSASKLLEGFWPARCLVF